MLEILYGVIASRVIIATCVSILACKQLGVNNSVNKNCLVLDTVAY